jgi:hypothetical protein
MDAAGAQALRAYLEARRDELLEVGHPSDMSPLPELQAWISAERADSASADS